MAHSSEAGPRPGFALDELTPRAKSAPHLAVDDPLTYGIGGAAGSVDLGAYASPLKFR